MRATLDIDADVLQGARALAETENKTLGQVLSELVRKGLTKVDAVPRLVGEAGSSPTPESGQEDAGTDRR